MEEKIFLTKQSKIFSSRFSVFSQTTENMVIFPESGFLKNIFLKSHVFREMNGVFMKVGWPRGWVLG